MTILKSSALFDLIRPIVRVYIQATQHNLHHFSLFKTAYRHFCVIHEKCNDVHLKLLQSKPLLLYEISIKILPEISLNNPICYTQRRNKGSSHSVIFSYVMSGFIVLMPRKDIGVHLFGDMLFF